MDKKMKTFKFHTVVSKTGRIQVPTSSKLFNKEVDVILTPKSAKKKTKSNAKDFVEKWAGFLNSKENDRAKFDYLSEKYK